MSLTVRPFLGGLSVHEAVLANGLRVAIVPDRSAPVVAVQTWFDVGSADEVAGKTGLAHLLEHLMFKGTEDYTEMELQERLDALGATGLNAWTWLDQTAYTEAVPRGALVEVLGLEASRMHRLRLDADMFASEREVVLNERRWAVDDDPGGLLAEALLRLAFPQHPYGWPTIGTAGDIAGLTVDDALAFYRRHYAPDTATLYLVGDVDPEAALALVRSTHGGLAPSGRTRGTASPDPRAPAHLELELPMTSDRVLLGLPAPAFSDPDIPALLVLDAALTAGRSGRLVRALVDGGVAADLSSMLLPLRQPSLLEIELRCRPGVSAEVATDAVVGVLDRVARDGLSEGELAMGAAQWQSATWVALEDASGKADFLGWAAADTGDFRAGVERLGAIQRVSADDVRRVAARWLRTDQLVRVTGRADPRVPAVPVRTGPVAPARRVVLPSRPRAEAADLPVGELASREHRGATVVELRDPVLPLVTLRLHLPTGAAADPDGLPGLTFLAGHMLLRGTARRDRLEFEDALEQLGASLGVSVDADGVTLSGTVLAAAWPGFRALLAEALAEPAHDPAELSLLVDEVAADLSGVADDDGQVAGRALGRLLHGRDHAYGRDPRGTVTSVRRVTVDDVRAAHARLVRRSGALLVVGGDLDAAVPGELDALLDGLAGLAPTPVDVAPPTARASRLLLVDKPDRTQGQVRAGLTGPPRHDQEGFAAFLLANDIFGVGFTGRLMREVRVARGWSYFAYSTPVLWRTADDWVLGLAPSLEQLPDALALVRQLVADAACDGFTERELEQARATRLGAAPFLTDSVRKRLDLELRRRVSGYDRLAATERMRSLTLGEVSAAFSRFVDPDALQLAVVATAADVDLGEGSVVGVAEILG